MTPLFPGHLCLLPHRVTVTWLCLWRWPCSRCWPHQVSGSKDQWVSSVSIQDWMFWQGEKILDKFQHYWRSKTLSKLRKEGKYFNLIKRIYEKKKQKNPTTVNIIHHDERLNLFSLILGKRQGCLLLLFIFNIILEDLVIAIRQEKKMKVLRLKRNK